MDKKPHVVSQLIWYEDGDIVLSVKEGDVEYQFRVHRLLLRLKPSLFRDMLAILQPPSTDSVECDIISLDDSAADLKALLTAVYDGLSMLREDDLDLDVALGILRLSDKYALEDLRTGIIHRLQEDWPLSYSDYIMRQKLLGSPESRIHKSIKLIIAAQQSGASTLVPSAFYELAATRITDWSEVERDAACGLTSEDLSRLFWGRELSRERLRCLFTWTAEDPPLMWSCDPNAIPLTILRHRATTKGCQKGGNTLYCKELLLIIRGKVEEQLGSGYSPFKIVRELGHTLFTGKGPCDPCTEWIITVFRNKEQEMWENIPKDFNISGIDPRLYTRSMFKPL